MYVLEQRNNFPPDEGLQQWQANTTGNQIQKSRLSSIENVHDSNSSG